MRSIVIVRALVAFVVVGMGGAAQATILPGDFAPGDPWYVGPGTTTGLSVDFMTDQITRTSDGAVFDLPLEIRDGATWVLEFHLSPSQQFLYVAKSNPGGSGSVCNGSSQLQVLMYELGAPPALLPFSSVSGPACIEGPLSQQPRFFDALSIVRTMVLFGAAGGGAGSTATQVLWADLIGRQMGVNGNTYLNGVSVASFAPSGNAALVLHGTSPSVNDPKYTIVDLCAAPLGGTLSTNDRPSGSNVRAEVQENAGTFRAVVFVDNVPVPGPGAVLSTACCEGPIACCFPYDGCDDTLTAAACASSGGVPLSGDCTTAGCVEACCLEDGTCALLDYASCSVPQGSLSCDPATCPQPTQACCPIPSGVCGDDPVADCISYGYIPQGPGTTCHTTTCPVLNLTLTKNGPAEIERGATFDYTIDYVNDGDLDAPGVVIEDYLPLGAEFVSASGGGVDVGFGQIQWNLGDVPAAGAGSSGQLTVTVRAGCSWDSVSNSATATTTLGGATFYSDTVFTQLLPPPSDPLVVGVVSMPSDGSPVEAGDLITHTITLTNTLAQPRTGLRFTIGAGTGMAFETLLDDGGGTVDMFSTSSWSWSGTIGPLATVDVVVTTRIDDCVDLDDVGLQSIEVYHACGPPLQGSAEPERFPVRRAVEVDVVATSLNPPADLVTFISRTTYQLMRAGDTVDFRFTATNPHPGPIVVDVTVPLAPGFAPVGDPPFIPPTDTGAIWNATQRRITWSGTLSPQQTVSISFRAIETIGPRPSGFNGWASDGTCNMVAVKSLQILPEIPAEPHVIGFDGRLWFMRPGTDTVEQELFRTMNESPNGVDRGPNGDIWVVSLPLYRINPITLELQGFELDFFQRLGFTPQDVAVDPTDGTVLFSGATWNGSASSAAIRRYDPATDQVSVVWNDPGPSPIAGIVSLVVEPSGAIGFRGTNNRLYRLDPAVGTPVDLSAFPGYSTLTLDPAGSYLVTPRVFAAPYPLLDVAPTSGAHSTVVADLGVLLPSAQLPPVALAAGGNGDVYFAYRFAGLGVVHRQGTPTAEEMLPFSFSRGQIIDLVAGDAGSCADGDGDGITSGSGCAPGSTPDCDDADPDVYPGAPEINDGKDNQCPGDPGAGSVDEIGGLASFDGSRNLWWTAQAGATQYEVVRSTTPDFSSGCTRWTTAGPGWSDGAQPGPGGIWHYLVRALLPFAGSFGPDSIVTCP